MKVLSFKFTLLLATVFFGNASIATAKEVASQNTDEFPIFSELGSEKFPILLDLSQSTKTNISSATTGKAYIKIKNIAPKEYDSLIIKVDSTQTAPEPFTGITPAKPSTVNFLDGSDIGKLDKFNDELESAEQDSELPGKIGRVRAAQGLANFESDSLITAAAEAMVYAANAANASAKDAADAAAKVAADAAAKVAADAAAKVAAADDVLKKASELLRKTEFQFGVTAIANSTINIEVQSGLVKQSAVIASKPTEWMTHVGFTFAQNKNNRFYSRSIKAQKGVPASGTTPATEDVPAHFEVAAQGGSGDIAYSATVLWTYPIGNIVWDIGNGTIKHGPTAGLSANTNSIAAIIGWSLIFNQNVVLAAGVEVAQFDDIKGTYQVGQDIGDKAIDSNDLIEKQFKATPMISIGYKFK